jgi:UDP-N-acetylglucosamine transferase subunit ALG13
MTVRDDLSAVGAQRRPLGEPVVFVSVGTDHHPFDRVVRWADAWAAAHPEAHVVVQYGLAAAPVTATGHLTLPYAEMQRQMRLADVVVTQGGPAGIMNSRAIGRLPIVVPRTASLGEHVDDHQIAFAWHMHAQGRIALATDEATFAALVSRAIAQPADFIIGTEETPTAKTVAVIDAAIGRLVADGPRRRGFRR